MIRSVNGMIAAMFAALAACARHATTTSQPAATALQRPTSDTGRTAVLQLTSRTFNNTRAIRVHLPPGYDDAANAARRYTVLYMNDGFAVFSPRLWSAPRIVDSLVVARAIEPIVLVGIDNAASIPGSATPDRDRMNEFLPFPDALVPELPTPHGDQYPTFVVDEVMPLVAARFRVASERSRTFVGGSSHGGIAALYTFLRHPARFGGLLLESSATFLFGGRLIRESATVDPPPAVVYIGIGTRETTDSTVLAAAGRVSDQLEDVFRQRGSRVLFNRVEGAAHEAAAWRARFPTALTFLFGTGRPR